MKKIIAFASVILLLLGLLAGCGAETPESSAPTSDTVDSSTGKSVNVSVIAGPTGVGMVRLMQKQTDGQAKNQYNFNVVTAPEQAVAAISNGTADIAAVPTNLAATLYKKTNGKVQVLALNTLGVLHILTNGVAVNSIQDLRGQTIYTSGQGANPEYILRYVLTRHGLDPDKDVKLKFVGDNDALASVMASGVAKVAMVPEPKASAVIMQNSNIKRALNMTEEWAAVNNSDIPLTMGCVVARKEFIEQNPDVINTFLNEYVDSLAYVVDNVDAAADLCATYQIIPKAALAKAAIPNCGLTFASGSKMKKELSGYLLVLYKFNPAAIGGLLPEDDFYYVP